MKRIIAFFSVLTFFVSLLPTPPLSEDSKANTLSFTIAPEVFQDAIVEAVSQISSGSVLVGAFVGGYLIGEWTAKQLAKLYVGQVNAIPSAWKNKDWVPHYGNNSEQVNSDGQTEAQARQNLNQQCEGKLSNVSCKYVNPFWECYATCSPSVPVDDGVSLDSDGLKKILQDSLPIPSSLDTNSDGLVSEDEFKKANPNAFVIDLPKVSEDQYADAFSYPYPTFQDTQTQTQTDTQTQSKTQDVALTPDSIADAVDEKIASDVQSVSISSPEFSKDLFDTKIETPKSPNLFKKFSSFLSVLDLNKRVRINFQGTCSFSANLPFFKNQNIPITFNFCRFQPQLEKAGNVLYTVTLATSLLILFGL